MGMATAWIIAATDQMIIANANPHFVPKPLLGFYSAGRPVPGLALASTLAVVSLALVILAVAAGFATPDDTSDPGHPEMFVLGSCLGALLFGGLAFLSFRRSRGRNEPA